MERIKHKYVKAYHKCSTATHISSISLLRRVDSNVDTEQKMIAPRKCYGDQWGFLCPNETPEGQPTGLVYQMSLTAQISTSSKNKRMFQQLKLTTRVSI